MNTKSILGGAIVGGIIVYILMNKKVKKCPDCGKAQPPAPVGPIFYPSIVYPAPPPPPPPPPPPHGMAGFNGFGGLY